MCYYVECQIPSHIGIKGNDKADSAAKTAQEGPIDKNFKIPYMDLKQKIKLLLLNKWQLRWNNSPLNKLQSIKTEIGEWKEGYKKSRREETVLSRLRIGHTNITHSYLLKREQPPWCEGCHAPFSVEHILIECIDLVPKRQQYYTANNLKDLFEHVKVDIILKFLKAVGLYGKI